MEERCISVSCGLGLDAYTLAYLRNKALYINLGKQRLSCGMSQYMLY